MYNIIQMESLNAAVDKQNELDAFNEESLIDTNFMEDNSDEMEFKESFDYGTYFAEAVFADGKKTVEPMLKCIEACKNLLMEEITAVDESIDAHKKDASVDVKVFNPTRYWKNQVWRDFEDTVADIFGFRYCEINPYRERYFSREKIFESRELNCAVGHPNRYPIEGLVTDKGYYDKSHSSVMYIYITLGLIKELEPEEILAVFLHEFGHSIDPALTNISYAETNILSKYLTDRKGSLTPAEKKLMKEQEKKHGFGGILLILFLVVPLIPSIISAIRTLIVGKEKIRQEKLDKVKAAVKKEKDLFRRQSFSEAYADNFARMYGYGAILARSLSKLSKDTEKVLNKWVKKETQRETYIAQMAIDSMKDVHKTDIHRVRNLMKEYKDDIDDPNTPPMIKKALQDDLTELEKVLDKYLNDFSDFQNAVNKIINDELIEKEKREEKKEKKEKDEKKPSEDKSEKKSDDESKKESDSVN